jgi:hypothetical protein
MPPFAARYIYVISAVSDGYIYVHFNLSRDSLYTSKFKATKQKTVVSIKYNLRNVTVLLLRYNTVIPTHRPND